MAQCILFGKDLSLAFPDAGADLGASAIAGNIAAADDYCFQAPGKKDHTTELVDYLGVLPVLETGVKTPTTPSPRSHESCEMVNVPESISTQLTMFYAGTVNVFDNVIADKAQIVLSFAEKSTSMQAITPSFKMPMASSMQPCASFVPYLQDRKKRMQPEKEEHSLAAHVSVGERLPVIKEDGNAQESAALLIPCQAVVPTALPIARKASLARFLEKRRERVRMAAPYLAKRCASNIIYQQGGAHQSSASTLERYYHEFFGGPNAKKLGCASGFAYINTVDVEEHNWFASVETSKQASESESAT